MLAPLLGEPLSRPRILLADENVKAVLINIFGGIVRCDMVANGVVAAAKNLGVSIPIVARLEGTNVEEGKRVLNESGIGIISADGMSDAAQKVANDYMIKVRTIGQALANPDENLNIPELVAAEERRRRT